MANLEDENVEMLGLATGGDERAAPEQYSTDTSSDGNNINWYRNKIGDNPRIMVRNIGLGESETAAVVKVSISNSQFGKGACWVYGGHRRQGRSEELQ